MVRPTAVRALSGHRIWLAYADGTEGEIDLSHLVGKGVFAAWRDDSFFASVRIDASGAIAWGEAIDLCPDALYLALTGKAPEDLFPGLKIGRDA